MNLQRLICPVCGDNLKEQGDGSYICECCSNKFFPEVVDKEAEKLKNIFDEKKEEAYLDAKRNLFQETHKEYLSDKDISYWCNEVKKYVPDDLMANFYDVFGVEADVDAQCDFLCDFIKHNNSAFAEEILRFSIKVADSDRLIAPLVGVLETFGLGGSDYRNQINELAEKLNDATFMTDYPRDVFVLYSSKDIETVTSLVSMLEQNGLTCFYASRNLRHGKNAKDNYVSELQKAMHNCKSFLFVSSKNSRRMDCDAMKIEIPYLQKSEANKKRVEYIIDESEYDKTAPVIKRVIDSYFSGQNRCKDLDDLTMKIYDAVSGFDETISTTTKSSNTNTPKPKAAAPVATQKPKEEHKEERMDFSLPETKDDLRCQKLINKICKGLYDFPNTPYSYNENNNCYTAVFSNEDVSLINSFKGVLMHLPAGYVEEISFDFDSNKNAFTGLYSYDDNTVKVRFIGNTEKTDSMPKQNIRVNVFRVAPSNTSCLTFEDDKCCNIASLIAKSYYKVDDEKNYEYNYKKDAYEVTMDVPVDFDNLSSVARQYLPSGYSVKRPLHKNDETWVEEETYSFDNGNIEVIATSKMIILGSHKAKSNLAFYIKLLNDRKSVSSSSTPKDKTSLIDKKVLIKVKDDQDDERCLDVITRLVDNFYVKLSKKSEYRYVENVGYVTVYPETAASPMQLILKAVGCRPSNCEDECSIYNNSSCYTATYTYFNRKVRLRFNSQYQDGEYMIVAIVDSILNQKAITEQDPNCLDIVKRISKALLGDDKEGDNFKYDDSYDGYSLANEYSKSLNETISLVESKLPKGYITVKPAGFDDDYGFTDAKYSYYNDKVAVTLYLYEQDGNTMVLVCVRATGIQRKDDIGGYVESSTSEQKTPIKVETKPEVKTTIGVQQKEKDVVKAEISSVSRVPEVKTSQPISNKQTLSSISIHKGDIFKFGSYPQSTDTPEPIEWEVLDVVDGKALLFANKILDCKRFAANSNNYANSEIRSWINNEFYNRAFNDEEKERILVTKVDNSVRSSNLYRNPKELNGGRNDYTCADTQDKIFLLSLYEITNPNYGFNADPDNYDLKRRKKPTKYAVKNGAFISIEGRNKWETIYKDYGEYSSRSPYYYDSTYPNGIVNDGRCSGFFGVFNPYCGVAPALWIKVGDSKQVSKSSYQAENKVISTIKQNQINLHKGDIFKFGSYPQKTNYSEPIEWDVLDVVDNKALLFAHNVLDAHRFDYTTCKYKDSEVRQWLNNDFYNKAFNSKEKARILITEVDNSERSTNTYNNPTAFEGGKNQYATENTYDKVFLPSMYELTNPNYGFDTNPSALDKKRVKFVSNYAKQHDAWTYPNNAGTYSLRSPKGWGSKGINFVVYGPGNCDGDCYVDYTNRSIVPAIWIDLSDESNLKPNSYQHIQAKPNITPKPTISQPIEKHECKFCTKCSAENDKDAKKCVKCGNEDFRSTLKQVEKAKSSRKFLVFGCFLFGIVNALLVLSIVLKMPTMMMVCMYFNCAWPILLAFIDHLIDKEDNNGSTYGALLFGLALFVYPFITGIWARIFENQFLLINHYVFAGVFILAIVVSIFVATFSDSDK